MFAHAVVWTAIEIAYLTKVTLLLTAADASSLFYVLFSARFPFFLTSRTEAK